MTATACCPVARVPCAQHTCARLGHVTAATAAAAAAAADVCMLCAHPKHIMFCALCARARLELWNAYANAAPMRSFGAMETNMRCALKR